MAATAVSSNWASNSYLGAAEVQTTARQTCSDAQQIRSSVLVARMERSEANFLGGVASVKGVKGFDPEAAKMSFFEIYLDKYAKPNSGIGFPGAYELIVRCKNKGFKVVASSVDRIKVDAYLAAAGLQISIGLRPSSRIEADPREEIGYRAKIVDLFLIVAGALLELSYFTPSRFSFSGAAVARFTVRLLHFEAQHFSCLWFCCTFFLLNLVEMLIRWRKLMKCVMSGQNVFNNIYIDDDDE